MKINLDNFDRGFLTAWVAATIAHTLETPEFWDKMISLAIWVPIMVIVISWMNNKVKKP